MAAGLVQSPTGTWESPPVNVDNDTPIATIQSSTTSGTAPLTVTFDASSSYDPDGDTMAVTWLFGDGDTSKDIASVHTYSTGGSYAVTLIVEDEKGATGTASAAIAVLPEQVPIYSDRQVTDSEGSCSLYLGDEIVRVQAVIAEVEQGPFALVGKASDSSELADISINAYRLEDTAILIAYDRERKYAPAVKSVDLSKSRLTSIDSGLEPKFEPVTVTIALAILHQGASWLVMNQELVMDAYDTIGYIREIRHLYSKDDLIQWLEMIGDVALWAGDTVTNAFIVHVTPAVSKALNLGRQAGVTLCGYGEEFVDWLAEGIFDIGSSVCSGSFCSHPESTCPVWPCDENVVPGTLSLDALGPIAIIESEPAGQGDVSTRFIFDGSKSAPFGADIVHHEWTFDDSTSATGARVSHTFDIPGDHTVTLSVMDSYALKDTQSLTVHVDPLPQRDDITPSTSTLHPPEDVILPATEARRDQNISFDYEVALGNDGSFFTAIIMPGEDTYHKEIQNSGSYTGELRYTAPDVGETKTFEIQGQMCPTAEGQSNSDSEIVSFKVSTKEDNSQKYITNLEAVNQMLSKAAEEYDLPPVLLKAIAFQESEWDHNWQPGDVRGKTGTVKINKEEDGRHGIGIMQVTVYLDDDQYDRLKNDMEYNIDQGAKLLQDKWKEAQKGNPSGMPEDNRYIIKNWWYPTLMYNGWGGKALDYISDVRSYIVAAPPDKIEPFMDTLGWTSPFEVNSDFELGDYMSAREGDKFIFLKNGKEKSISAPVHYWTNKYKMDSDPPTVPQNLNAKPVSPTEINLSWDKSTDNIGVAGYRVYREGDYQDTVKDTSYRDSGLSSYTRYCYKVSAFDKASNESDLSNNACTRTKSESLLPAPQLREPGNKATGVLTRPTFSWSSVSGANYYWLTVATDPRYLPTDPNAASAPGCVIGSNGVGISGTSYTPSTSLDSGTTYYWKVQAYHGSDAYHPDRQGQYSDQWSFTTTTPTPTLLSAPRLSSPTNGQGDVSLKPTFSWSSVSGANYYWLTVATDPRYLPTDPNAASAPGCVIGSNGVGISGTSYTPSTSLDSGTTYYWKVQAYHGSDAYHPDRQGQYSDQWSFTTTTPAPSVILVSVTDSPPKFQKGSYSGHPEYWRSYTHQGHTYIYTYTNGNVTDCWAEFRPYLTHAGTYEVYACFFADPENSRRVPYTIHHAGGSTTIRADEYAPNYFTWREVRLGSWYFATGADTRVVVTDATDESYDGWTTLNVDTIKFVER